MALRDQPYLPLYIQDFLTDEKLSECSAESTGVYIRLMCLMHKSRTYGTILLKQKDKQNDEQILNFALKLVRQMPYSVDVIKRSLEELLEEDVVTLDGDCLFQKRMVKDAKLSDIRASAARQRGTRSKNLTVANGFDKKFAIAKTTSKPLANTEIESENENETENDIGLDKLKKCEEKKSKKPIKVNYAEFVSMTEEEYGKLVAEHGTEKTKRAIEVLDNYKGSKGKTYKSDYRAILSWVIERVNEEFSKRGGGNYGGFNPDRGHTLQPTGNPGDFKPSGGFKGQ